jgi:phenylpropionate dioxygenase-like ring-hydroxylating dioxygenase large terminal subunit
MELPRHWYAIALSSEVKEGKTLALRRFSQSLVLWRGEHQQLVVMEDRCPHRLAQLSLGEIKNHRIQCPFHGFQFNVQGQCDLVPELGKAVPHLCVRTYSSREKDGWIYLWWGSDVPDREPPEWFPGLDSSFCTVLLQERWNTHVTRSIENQLDYAHLPYVHRKSIGRFATSIERVPNWVLDDQKIHFSFPPARPQDPQSYIEFRFPNLWINRISEDYSITLAFVPVDEEWTDLYLQNHRRFLNIPFLNSWINFFMVWLNRRILNEDKHVVMTQFPRDVREAKGEHHFPSDKAILHFRKWLKTHVDR